MRLPQPAGNKLLSNLSTEKPGDLIGRYKSSAEDWRRGMGSVWMAEQLEPVRRQVALKLITWGKDSSEGTGTV